MPHPPPNWLNHPNNICIQVISSSLYSLLQPPTSYSLNEQPFNMYMHTYNKYCIILMYSWEQYTEYKLIYSKIQL